MSVSLDSFSSSTTAREFALDKLKFSSGVKLYGREKEVNVIREVFETAVHKEKQLLLVSGAAGTGKSVLAHEVCSMVRELGGFYLMGKFEMQEKDEPFSGIAMAFGFLCEDLLLHKQTTDISNSYQRWSFTFSDFVEKLKSDIDPDAIELLLALVPSLGEVVGIERKSLGENQNYLERKNAFRDAFLRFLRVIVAFGPLVFLLNDMHWMDEASMDLVQSTMLDESLQTVMIVGTYRDNEVDENHLLTARRKVIQQGSIGESNVTEIKLKALAETDIADLLMDITGESSNNTKELAKLIEERTAGNALYVVQFLLSLQSQKLFRFDYVMDSWCWDIEAIKSGSMITENVVELLTDKLKSLDAVLQELLPRVACLGSRFSAEHFELLVKRYCDSGKVEEIIAKYKEERIETHKKRKASQASKSASDKHSKREGHQQDSLLRIFVTEALIVQSRGYYKWGHDRIEEAALGLADESSLQAMELEIGKLLLENNAQETDLFLVTNLLNIGHEGIAVDESIRVKLAELNLKSGNSALASSAFGPAAEYYVKGIKCLRNDKWTANFDVALELYSNASEAHMCIGDHDKTREFCDEVLKAPELTLLQKRRSYNAQIDSFASQTRAPEARDLCLSTLKGLGVDFPKFGQPFHVAGGLIRVITAVEKTTNQLKTLAPNTNEGIEWSLDLLDKLITIAYQCEDPTIISLAMLKGLRLTLNHGIATRSASILSVVALVLAGITGDLSGGKKYADLAIKLSSRQTEARVLFVTAVLVIHFQVPYEKCIEQFYVAHEVGMKTGDFESAFGAVQSAIGLSIHDGKRPLDIILEDCKKHIAQMKLYDQQLIVLCVQIYWQVAQNLSDGSTYALKGEHFDEDTFLQAEHEEKYLPTRLMYRGKLVTAFWFDNHEEVVRIMEQRKYHKFSMDKADPGMVENKPVYLYMGLSCVKMAIKYQGKLEARKHKKRATRFLKKIQALVKKGDPNLQHAEALLDAEFAGLYGNRYIAAAQYDVAILLGERWGFINDTALAHERFADFLMRQGETHKATVHYDTAFDLFEQWGAKCRVNALRSRVPHLKVPVHHVDVASALHVSDESTQVSAL